MDHNEAIQTGGSDFYCEGSSYCTITNNLSDQQGQVAPGAAGIITGAAVAGIAAGRHQLNALSSTTGLVAGSHVTLSTSANFPTTGITGVTATMDSSFTTGTVFYQNLSRNCGQVGPWWWLWLGASWQGVTGTVALVISNSTNLATQDVVMTFQSIGGTPVRIFSYGFGWGAGLGCGTSGMQSWGIVCQKSCTSHSLNFQDFELSGETFHNVIRDNRIRGGSQASCISLRNQESGLVEGNYFVGGCGTIQVNDTWPPVVVRDNITWCSISNCGGVNIIGVDSTNNGPGLSAAIDGGGNIGYMPNSPIGATGFLPMPVTYALTNGGIIMGGSSATPSISPGTFGTSPSVPCAITTTVLPCTSLAFTINVGTGGTASSGVIAMNSTAPTGWACKASDLTTTSATVFQTKQTATTQNTVTIGNFNTSGAAAAWVASDILQVNCTPY